jgi:hypothetical protein
VWKRLKTPLKLISVLPQVIHQLKIIWPFILKKMDAWWVNAELVTTQPSRFYGGWITSNIVGPFKREPRIKVW